MDLSHPKQARFWYILGVPFKITNDHPIIFTLTNAGQGRQSPEEKTSGYG